MKVFITNGIISRKIEKSAVEIFLNEHPNWRRGITHRHKRPPARWITNGKDDKFMVESEIPKFLSDNPNWRYGNSKSGGIKNLETQLFVTNNPSKSDKRRKEIPEFMLSDKNPMKTESGRHKNQEAQLSDEVLRKHAICKFNHPRSYQSRSEEYIINYLEAYFEVIPQFFLDNEFKYYHNYDALVKLPNGIEVLFEYDGSIHGKQIGLSPKSKYKDEDLREYYARLSGYEYICIKSMDRSKLLKFVKSQFIKLYPEFEFMHLDE